MRLFEILIAIIPGLTLAGWLYPRWRHPRIVHILPFAAVLIVPLQLLIDGHLWLIVFPALLPVKDLPEPGGPYGVGRWSIELTDSFAVPPLRRGRMFPCRRKRIRSFRK